VAVHADVKPPYDLHSFENVDTILCNNFVPLLLWTPPYYPTANNVWYHNGSPTATNTFSHTYLSVPPGDNYFWVANTDPNGCTLFTDTFHVYNQGLPPMYLYEQGNALTPNYGCMTTPQWTLNGEPYPSNWNVIIDPGPGCYQMTCVDCVTIVSDVYCILPTGVETPDRPAITIHPSPVQDRLLLSRDLHRDARIHITDAAGRTIHSGGITGRSIDVGIYAPGIYLLVVKEDGVERAVRWVKE